MTNQFPAPPKLYTVGALAGKAKTTVAQKRASYEKILARMQTPAYWSNQIKVWLKKEVQYVSRVKKAKTPGALANAKRLSIMASKKVEQAKANYKRFGGK